MTDRARQRKALIDRSDRDPPVFVAIKTLTAAADDHAAMACLEREAEMIARLGWTVLAACRCWTAVLDHSRDITSTGQSLATLDYASAEQLRGRHPPGPRATRTARRYLTHRARVRLDRGRLHQHILAQLSLEACRL